MKRLKQFILTLCLMISTQFLNAQTDPQTFNIVNNGSAIDIKAYEDAIKSSNMESYRYKTKRDTIIFDNGVEIELLSAQELYLSGMTNINISEYSDERDARYVEPIFHLVEVSGPPQAPGQKPYIIALYTHVEK